MSSQRADKSHAVAWLLAVVLVPVVYLLSVPPIAILASGAHAENPPYWSRLYCAPADWLVLRTPLLQSTMKQYGQWWSDKLH